MSEMKERKKERQFALYDFLSCFISYVLYFCVIFKRYFMIQ